jgi:hypothetical protein
MFGQSGEILPNFPLQPGFGDFFAQDRIRFANDRQFFLGHFA